MIKTSHHECLYKAQLRSRDIQLLDDLLGVNPACGFEQGHGQGTGERQTIHACVEELEARGTCVVMGFFGILDHPKSLARLFYGPFSFLTVSYTR